MRQFMILCSVLLSANAFGAVNNLSSGQLFMGEEMINEQPSGKMCYVAIASVGALESKGTHCGTVQIKIHTGDERVPQGALSINSRITNYDTPSYQAGFKSCAMKLDGTIAGNEIFGQDTAGIYTPFFGGMVEIDGVEYHSFLSISPVTKLPVRTRVHLLSTFEEADIDCVNLKQM